MKLQVEKFHKFAVAAFSNPMYIGHCGDTSYQIDSVHILWAADSMGNGIFKHPPVRAINQKTLESFSSIPSLNCLEIRTTNGNIEFLWPFKEIPIKSLRIFNLNGSLLCQWQNPGRRLIWDVRFVPAGVYMASATLSNGQMMGRRLVLRK